MNKVTLSVVALAAVGAPVQMQAASADEIAAAKQKAFDEVSQLNSAAVNLVNTYHDQVKKIYLDQLSAIQAELNKEFENKEDEAIDVAYYDGKIKVVLEAAAEAEKPYDVYDELKDSFDKLQAEYDAAYAEAGNYELVGPGVKENLETIGVKALGEKINGYDLTTQNICADKPSIVETIKNYSEQIATYVKDIAAKETAAQNAKDDAAKKENWFNEVKAAIDAAKAAYNAQLQEAIKLLPGDPDVYGDWQAEAIDKLNEEYRKLVAVEKNNTTEGTVEEAEKRYKENTNAIGVLTGNIASILTGYKESVNVQKDAKATYAGLLENLNKSIEAVKAEIKRCLITKEFGETADAIAVKIEDLEKQAEEAYKNHNVDKLDKGLAGAIEQEIAKLNNDMAPYVANFDAYAANNATIDGIQTKLAEAVKVATETVSDDKKYKASDYLTTAATMKLIAALKAEADKAYEEGKAVDYKNNTIEGKVAAIQAEIDNYSTLASNSLAAYNAAAKLAADSQKALDELVKAVTDKTVTVDGTLEGVTYQEKIDKISAEIKAINDAIAAALTVKDAKHQEEMAKAAALTISEDIKALTDSYNDNKAAFDKASAINAAGNMLAEANASIQALRDTLAAANTGADLGNQQTAIEGEINTLNGEIDAVAAKLIKNWDSLSDDEKYAKATEVVASLSEINVELDKLEPKVQDVYAKAQAARENHAAYVAVSPLADLIDSDAAKAIAKAREELAVAEDFENSEYYDDILGGYQADLVKIKAAIEKDYADVALVAKKADHEASIADLIAKVEKVVPAAKANEIAHKDQVAKNVSSQEAWNTAYETISTNDESTQAKEWLAQLATVQESINALVKAVEDNYLKGNSDAYNTDYTAANESINAAIANILKGQSDGYNEAIDKDNQAQINAFEAEYAAAYKTFSDAVNTLNEFSTIKNEALQTALDNLIETHDAIYAYADKLRKLKADELKDRNAHISPVLYSSEAWIEIANQYDSEISALILEYQNTVNAKALAEYKDDIDAAAAKLTAAKATVADYTCDTSKAFADVESLVKAAQDAAKLDAEGNPTDKKFAVNIDKWLDGFKNIDKMIDADKKAIAETEWNTVYAAATKLYETEKAEILKLKEINTADYVKALDELKKISIDAAYESIKDVDNKFGAPLADAKALLAKYTNGADNSTVYTDAKAASADNVANVEAYNEIQKMLQAATATVDKVAEQINSLYVAHLESNSVSGQLAAIYDMLNYYAESAETQKKLGGCVGYKPVVDLYVNAETGAMLGDIEALKSFVIPTEIMALESEIGKVKEEYNQAAKNDAANLDKVKEYDAKIAALYAALLTNSEGGTDVETSIEWKWNNDKLTFEAACAELVALEGQIAKTGKELTDMYDEGAYAAAQTAVDAEIAKLQAELDDANGKLAEYSDLAAKYGDAVEEIAGALGLIEADYAEKKDAGTLLFYKDNLINDIALLIADTEDEFNDIDKDYAKYQLNDKCKAELDGLIAATKAELERVKEVVAAYQHPHNVWVDTDGDGSLDAYVDYRTAKNEDLQKQIGIIEALIAAEYKNVTLDDSDITTFSPVIAQLVNDIVTYERTATYDEANYLYNVASSANNAARSAMEGKNYGGDRRAQLVSEYNSIRYALNNLSNYAYDAYQDNNIRFDIDGNYVEVDGVPVAQDFMKTAWPNITAKLGELNTAIEQFASDVVEMSYILGDADNDKRVTVLDYDQVRRWVLEAKLFTDISEAQRYAADVNGDSEINVADMTAISNIIFNIENDINSAKTSALIRKAPVAGDNEISVVTESEETTVFGKTVRLALNVANSAKFVAGQMDIQLPQGMTIVGESLSSRANGHELLSNNLSDGSHRMVISHIENNEFVGNSGAIVYLDVEVSSSFNGGNIVISNAIFTDAMAKTYALGLNGGEATGIEDIKAATAKERIYSVGGQVMKAMKKGINIIVGENGKSKKVIK